MSDFGIDGAHCLHVGLSPLATQVLGRKEEDDFSFVVITGTVPSVLVPWEPTIRSYVLGT